MVREGRLPAFERPFLAVDGEARGDRYVLLAGSEGGNVWDPRGLATEDALDFLIDLPRPRILVAFGLDYDVNQILADLPLRGERHSVGDLYVNGFTYWHDYRLRYVPRKFFGISRGSGKDKRSVTVYDVWSFFTSSFIGALEEYGIEVPAIIREGKAARGSFESWPKHRIVAYNAAEVELLVLLCDKLRDALRGASLPVSSWHGPGAVASEWLKRQHARDYIEQPGITKRMETAIASAYFGGRIDASGWGVVDPVYHYDLVSAYPAAIAELPNLTRLRWRRSRRIKRINAQRPDLLLVRWDVSDLDPVWGPLPWRDDTGAVLWPHVGAGWYWSVEVAAARRRFGADRIVVEEGYVADGVIERPLRDAITTTFRERARRKRAGDPSERALKLALNSLYGKTAQSVGEARFKSWTWAGLITAHARARIADGIAAVGDENVRMVMTDGLWSAAPLPRAMLSNDLGGWTREEEKRLAVLEPGIYKADTHSYHRGFETPPDVDAIIRWWERGMPKRGAPRTTFEPIRFIGMGPALVINGVYVWRDWKLCERKIEPVPVVGTTKRVPYVNDGGAVDGWHLLAAVPATDDDLSRPYVAHTLDEDLKRRILEDECAEDVETRTETGR